MVDADEFLKKGMVIEWVDVLFSTVRRTPSMLACIYFPTRVIVSWSMAASLILDLSHTEAER
jgi:hypothetical protein